MKKLKERFGGGGEEEEDEDDKKVQAPLSLTQAQGEDVEVNEEGAKGEESKEAPKPTKKKKRKAKEPKVEKPKKKLVKISQQKKIVLATRYSTRETTKQVKLAKKPKGKRTVASTKLSHPTKKTYIRRKYTLVAE